MPLPKTPFFKIMLDVHRFIFILEKDTVLTIYKKVLTDIADAGDCVINLSIFIFKVGPGEIFVMEDKIQKKISDILNKLKGEGISGGIGIFYCHTFLRETPTAPVVEACSVKTLL